MPLSHAVVLGILQGLAEFLPVSSSAHLTLAPWLLGWDDPGLGFDVALHVGTLIAVLWYFRAEWARLVAAALSLLRNRRMDTPEKRRVIYLVVATIPGAVAGLALEKLADRALRTPALIAAALIVMGILLWAVDRTATRRRDLDSLTARDAVLSGLSQAFALIPGVSRSGATITAARALGVGREGAAVFSFLMSMPIIAAAAVLKVPHVLRTEGITPPLLVGVLAAALSSAVAITVLLRYVSRHSYGLFALYRIALGAGVLAVVATRG
ncbi:MAG: undecaprenyl-diphosphatase UppP [Gemmatimonadaceae bacterium]